MAKKEMKITFHGWILLENAGEGFKDCISVEWTDADGRHHFGGINPSNPNGWRGESGCAQAVEWWDKKVGNPVKLLPALKGSYRVFTEEAA